MLAYEFLSQAGMWAQAFRHHFTWRTKGAGERRRVKERKECFLVVKQAYIQIQIKAQ
jgi:hypothetical protein